MQKILVGLLIGALLTYIISQNNQEMVLKVLWMEISVNLLFLLAGTLVLGIVLGAWLFRSKKSILSTLPEEDRQYLDLDGE